MHAYPLTRRVHVKLRVRPSRWPWQNVELIGYRKWLWSVYFRGTGAHIIDSEGLRQISQNLATQTSWIMIASKPLLQELEAAQPSKCIMTFRQRTKPTMENIQFTYSLKKKIRNWLYWVCFQSAEKISLALTLHHMTHCSHSHTIRKCWSVNTKKISKKKRAREFIQFISFIFFELFR